MATSTLVATIMAHKAPRRIVVNAKGLLSIVAINVPLARQQPMKVPGGLEYLPRALALASLGSEEYVMRQICACAKSGGRMVLMALAAVIPIQRQQ